MDEYTKKADALRLVIYNYDLPLGQRLDAWTAWCKGFDEKEAREAKQVESAAGYAL